MRIVEVLNARALGGVETHVWGLSQKIAKTNDVEILAPNPHVRAVSTRDIGRLKITEFPAFAPSDFYFFSPSLYRFLKKIRTAVVHAHGCQGFSTFASALAKTHNGLPLVVTPHYSFTRVPLMFNLYNHIANRFVYSKSDRIVCVSPTELTILRKIGGFLGKAIYIPNGVDFEIIDRYIAKCTRQKWPKTVLFVGRLEKDKGIQHVIRALSKNKGQILFLIVGTGPFATELSRMVDKFNMKNEVIFLGKVSFEKLMNLYARSHIFVLPSKYESHSMALTEAMAFGLGIITTKVGGNPHLISNDSGILISYPVKEDELASALNRFLQDENLLDKTGKHARKKAKMDFNINLSLKRLEQVYSDLYDTLN